MKRPLLILSVILFKLLSAYYGWGYYNDHYFESERIDTPAAFRYMNYACGDCHPQWKLASPNSYNMATMKISDHDIDIRYRGARLENILPAKEQSCMVCVTIFVTGSLQTTMSGKYRIDADKYYFTTRPNCCSE